MEGEAQRTNLRTPTCAVITLPWLQVGKFYEIFNQDADVAIRALNGTPNAMVYMKGEKVCILHQSIVLSLDDTPLMTILASSLTCVWNLIRYFHTRCW